MEKGRWLSGLCKACEEAGLRAANMAPTNTTSAEVAPTTPRVFPALASDPQNSHNIKAYAGLLSQNFFGGQCGFGYAREAKGRETF